MAAFSVWLRMNSEHYLLRDSQTRLSQSYGLPPVPAEASGIGPFFWRSVFVPVYRFLPWGLRRRILHRIPGSHRQLWAVQPRRNNPAI